MPLSFLCNRLRFSRTPAVRLGRRATDLRPVDPRSHWITPACGDVDSPLPAASTSSGGAVGAAPSRRNPRRLTQPEQAPTRSADPTKRGVSPNPPTCSAARTWTRRPRASSVASESTGSKLPADPTTRPASPAVATPEFPWSGRLHRSVPQRPPEQCSSEASGKSPPWTPNSTPSACLPTCLHPQTSCVLGPPRRLTKPPDGHEPHVAERLVPIEPIHEHDLRQPLAPRDVRRICRLAGGPALCRTSPAKWSSPGVAPPKRDNPLCPSARAEDLPRAAYHLDTRCHPLAPRRSWNPEREATPRIGSRNLRNEQVSPATLTRGVL